MNTTHDYGATLLSCQISRRGDSGVASLFRRAVRPCSVEHLVHFLTVQDRNGNDDASLPAELPSKAIGIQAEKSRMRLMCGC